MITYEKWQAALSNEAMAGVAAMFDGAKNKNTCIDLIRWFTATGRVWRTRDGLNIVRGSVKGRPDGLKENAFLQSIGITAAKIRGFVKLALERGVLEILSPPNQPDEDGDLWRYNRNGRPRNPAIVYRFSKGFLATLRKGQPRQESGTRVALQPAAKPSCSSSVLAPIAEDIHSSLGSGGYLPSSPAPAASTTGPRLTISQRAMQPFQRPRIPLPVIQQPAPSAPATPSGPLHGKLAAAAMNLKTAIFGGQATRVPAPGFASPLLAQPVPIPKAPVDRLTLDAIEGDRRFELDFPTVIKLVPAEWPQVYDEAGGIKNEVYRWLMEHAGMPGRGHGIRTFHQPDTEAARRAGLTPTQFRNITGLDRDMRLGFRDLAYAVEFKFAWGGAGMG